MVATITGTNSLSSTTWAKENHLGQIIIHALQLLTGIRLGLGHTWVVFASSPRGSMLYVEIYGVNVNTWFPSGREDVAETFDAPLLRTMVWVWRGECEEHGED